ncbi:MAG: T9SS type A sorting domain-containing protein [Ignavibacteria bacterium]|nr:T9SS type A sorting domain-containing protein [Ignavibacteria bacterium]
MQRFISIFLFSIGLLFNDVLAADTLFVSPIAESGGDGQSWNAPYRNLQSAIDAWQSGDEIWIARGTIEVQSTGIKLDSTKSGIRMYGGFTGGETKREGRDWYRNPTILRATGTRFGILTVAGCDSLTRIDGLIFENANNIAVSVSGGAPHFRNCTFRDNTSTGSGAAMIIDAVGRMRVEYCVFINNQSIYNGGAVYVVGQADPGGYGFGMLFGQCFFVNNSGSLGGAICLENQAAIPQFTSCVFYGNVGRFGGAVATQRAYVYITNCTFAKNSLKSEAAHSLSAYLHGGSIQNSIFWNGDIGDSAKHVADVDVDFANDTNTLTSTANLIEKDFDLGFYQNDPQFEDIDNPAGADGFYGTDDDGLRLSSFSTVADAGVIDAFVNTRQTDAIGNPRLVDRKIDLGVYERQRRGRLSPPELLDELLKGELTLFFRHAKTDWSQKDPGPSPECFPGRNLIYEGREQSRTIGASQRLLNVPIGDVESSPVCRCWETAELMTGRYNVVSYWGSGGGEQTQRTRDSVLKTIPIGGTRIISSHEAVAIATLDADGDGRVLTSAELMEGDCLFIRPLTDTFEVIGQWSSDTWERYHVRFPEISTSVTDGESFDETVHGIVAHPQPASDVLHISAEVPETFQIVDVNGHVVLALPIGTSFTINTSQWASGMYVVRSSNSRATFIVSQ